MANPVGSNEKSCAFKLSNTFRTVGQLEGAVQWVS